jgi:hypothetical protein
MSTDTPRTDSAASQQSNKFGDYEEVYFVVDAEVSKEIERENARLREELGSANYSAQVLSDTVRTTQMQVQQLGEELAEAKRERDEAVTKMQQGWLEVTESGINHYKQVAEQAEASALANAKDAGRYLYVRQSDRAYVWSEILNAHITRAEDIDAAIDAAIAWSQA